MYSFKKRVHPDFFDGLIREELVYRLIRHQFVVGLDPVYQIFADVFAECRSTFRKGQLGYFGPFFRAVHRVVDHGPASRVEMCPLQLRIQQGDQGTPRPRQDLRSPTRLLSLCYRTKQRQTQRK